MCCFVPFCAILCRFEPFCAVLSRLSVCLLLNSATTNVMATLYQDLFITNERKKHQSFEDKEEEESKEMKKMSNMSSWSWRLKMEENDRVGERKRENFNYSQREKDRLLLPIEDEPEKGREKDKE